MFNEIIYKYKCNGQISTIPIIFQVKKNIITKKVKLIYQKLEVGYILVDEIFEINEEDLKYLYGVNDNNKLFHPGFIYQKNLGKYAIGGRPIINNANFKLFKQKYNFRHNFKIFFKKYQIKDAVSFQTRNPPHKGHEYQIIKSLNYSNNVVINPIFGWKKKDDFKEKIVKDSYKIFIKKNSKNIFFKEIQTNMRYLGPREAVHHAIIRQNLGFSYFIVGRDHAGVGGYYKKYDSFRLINKLNCNKKLKIKILKFREPKYCRVCDKVFIYRGCSHKIKYFNGTNIRNLLSSKKSIPSYLIDKEISELLRKNLRNLFQ